MENEKEKFHHEENSIGEPQKSICNDPIFIDTYFWKKSKYIEKGGQKCLW